MDDGRDSRESGEIAINYQFTLPAITITRTETITRITWRGIALWDGETYNAVSSMPAYDDELEKLRKADIDGYRNERMIIEFYHKIWDMHRKKRKL